MVKLIRKRSNEVGLVRRISMVGLNLICISGISRISKVNLIPLLSSRRRSMLHSRIHSFHIKPLASIDHGSWDLILKVINTVGW